MVLSAHSAPASAAATPAAAPLLHAKNGEPDSKATAVLPGGFAAAAAAPAGGFPSGEQSLSGTGSMASVAIAAHAVSTQPGQVDIRDLSWEDRERILRLLFAKINKAAQQRSVPPPVQHTQPVPEAEVEAPLPPLRGLATEAGPASLA
jgi:hypothetical protein